MDLFFFKKIISRFVFPLPLVVELLLAGLVLLWFTKFKRAGKALCTAATLLLIVLSTGMLTNFLLAPLEDAYPSLDPEKLDREKIQWIVVLGGGSFGSNHPLPTGLGESSLFRLVEGIRLQQEFPHAQLLLSGGSGTNEDTVASRMGEMATVLGVEPGRIVLEANSRDTAEQARAVGKMVGSQPFILVTSASHMPRSMALFEAQGLSPVAAPTFHQSAGEGKTAVWNHFPNGVELQLVERAWYEYLGILWARIRGQLGSDNAQNLS